MSTLSFSEQRVFASLVRFIPWYVMVWGAVVNGIDSLMSLPTLLLLVYRNASDFCASVLYRDTLQNSRTRSSRFVEWSLLGFPHKVSYHLHTAIVWLLLCRFGCLYCLFVVWLLRLGLPVLCWIAVVIVGNPAVLLTLAEKLSVFLHWEWYWLWLFHRWLWWYWGMCPLSLHFEGCLDQERMLYFVKCFFSIYREYQMVLALSFINALYHTAWFVDVEPTLQPWNQSHLVMVNNLFKALLDPTG